MKITKRLKKHLKKNHGLAKGAADADVEKLVGDKLKSGELKAEELAELTEVGDGDRLQKKVDQAVRRSLGNGITGEKIFGGGSDVRVKNVYERFSTKKYDTKHAKFGHEVLNPHTKQPVQTQSELDSAKMGAFMKWVAKRSFLPDLEMKDYELGLLLESADTDEWAAHPMDNEAYAYGKRDVTPDRVKTLLSDTISGGLYVNPLWFDQAVIEFPLLYGELLPFVDVVEMPRSSTINTAQVFNPTVTWGQPEGTSVLEFNTAALIAQISATVQNVMVAVEIGRDEMADAIVAIGQIIQRRIGERLMSDLDRVIGIGNGTTEPLGILNSSIFTGINSDNGVTSSPTVGDYEGLYFALPKQYRTQNWNVAFIGNDISYRRARAIPVGPGDERRVFGMTHQDYSVLNIPYRVQQQIVNSKLACCALKKYRLWRRLGMEMRWSIEGRNLMLGNTALLTMRGRYFGQVVDPAAVALMTDAMQ